jgi:hypothetical protein
MFDTVETHAPSWLRPKTLVFAAVAVMAAYVFYHNERFLIDPAHPAWQHYERFKWWLLPHGVSGACVLLLAPLQFSDYLRQRFRTLHRAAGGIYVTSAFVLAPLGAYIQYLDESQGAARSFTIETVIQATLLMTTTGMGLVFALKRMITQHRQWMIRSYAVALTFLATRFILGITGLDQPFDWAIVETVVWACTAMSLLVGDLANQMYELRTARATDIENDQFPPNRRPSWLSV